jgi:hypothetical protein
MCTAFSIPNSVCLGEKRDRLIEGSDDFRESLVAALAQDRPVHGEALFSTSQRDSFRFCDIDADVKAPVLIMQSFFHVSPNPALSPLLRGIEQ